MMSTEDPEAMHPVELLRLSRPWPLAFSVVENRHRDAPRMHARRNRESVARAVTGRQHLVVEDLANARGEPESKRRSQPRLRDSISQRSTRERDTLRTSGRVKDTESFLAGDADSRAKFVESTQQPDRLSEIRGDRERKATQVHRERSQEIGAHPDRDDDDAAPLKSRRPFEEPA